MRWCSGGGGAGRRWREVGGWIGGRGRWVSCGSWGWALLVAVGWFGSRCGTERGVSRISDSVCRIRLLRVLS